MTTTNPRVLGLAGRAGAGKTTFASLLQAPPASRWVRVSFAEPLKDMLRVGLRLTREQLSDPVLKETIDPRYGVTPRHLMQTLGTEWGRTHVRSDLWVTICVNTVQEHLHAGRNVVVDDVRYPEECDVIRKLGGVVVWVHKQETPPAVVCGHPTVPVSAFLPPTGAHSSEVSMDPTKCDCMLINRSGSVPTLETLLSVVRNAAWLRRSAP